MRIRILINRKFWRELDLEFLSPHDPEAVTVIKHGIKFKKIEL